MIYRRKHLEIPSAQAAQAASSRDASSSNCPTSVSNRIVPWPKLQYTPGGLLSLFWMVTDIEGRGQPAFYCKIPGGSVGY